MNRTKEAAFGVFFAGLLAVAPILALVVGPVKTRQTPPMPDVAELGVLDGQFAAAAMKHYEESSAVTVVLRAARHEFDHMFGLFEPRNAEVGPGFTMFLPLAPLRDVAERPAVLERIHEEAERLGVRLIVAPAPDKWRLYPEWYAEVTEVDDDRRRFYRDLITDFRTAGIEAVDLETPFVVRRASDPGMPFYTPRDTHWDLPARSLAASLIVERIGSAGWWEGSPTRSLQVTPPNPRLHVPDLGVQLGIAGPGPLARAYAQSDRAAAARGPNWEDPDFDPEECPWILCGDSFSVGMQGVLAVAGQRALDTSASVGGTLPLAQLDQTFARIESGEVAARIVVWVFVERLAAWGWRRDNVPERFRPSPR